MTPLLKKFLQTGSYPIENKNLPISNILLWKGNLRDEYPTVYENSDHIQIDVGYNWLKANLSDEEFAEFIAMKLRGQVI